MTYMGGAVLAMASSPGEFLQNAAGESGPRRTALSIGRPGRPEKQRDHLRYEKGGYGKMTCSEWDIFTRRCEWIAEQLAPELRSEVGSKEGNQQQLIVGTGEGRAQRKPRWKRRRDRRKWRRLECAKQKIARWIQGMILKRR